MLKILFILFTILLVITGCGNTETPTNTETNNSKENIIENTTDTPSNNDVNSDTEDNSDKVVEDDTVNSESTVIESIPFDLKIELPEGTTVGEFIPSATAAGTTGWLLKNPDYLPQREYSDVQDQLLWAKTSCGWIEKHTNNGQILPDGTPVYTSTYCTKQENGYWIESGYFCEVSMRVFSNARVTGKNIPEEYLDVKYWCIIYKETLQTYTWIFLDKDFYTEEQAKNVADSLPITKHRWVKELLGGYRLYIKNLDDYNIEYSEEPNGTQKLVPNESGEVIEISISPVIPNYIQVYQTQYLRDWHIWYEFDGEFVEYIDQKVGCSIYHIFSIDTAGTFVDEWGYLAIYGMPNSTTAYAVRFKGYELSEVYRILDAIHFDFE